MNLRNEGVDSSKHPWCEPSSGSAVGRRPTARHARWRAVKPAQARDGAIPTRIKGVPEDLAVHWSKRRAVIVDAAHDMGFRVEGNAARAAAANKITRAGKSPDNDPEVRHRRWRHESRGFCERELLIAELQGKAEAITQDRAGPVQLRFDYAPGLYGLSADFSGKTLALRTGRGEKDVEIFVEVLAHSCLIYAEAVPDQRARHWAMARRRALEHFGGVPERPDHRQPHPRLELRRRSKPYPHWPRARKHDPVAPLRHRPHQRSRARRRRDHAQSGQETAAGHRLPENDRQRRPAASARLTGLYGARPSPCRQPSARRGRTVMPR